MKGFFMLLAMVAQASLIFNDDHIDVAKVDYEDGGFLSRFARDLPDGSGDETENETEMKLGSPEDVETTTSFPSTDTNKVEDTTEVLEDGTGVTPAGTNPSAENTTTSASTASSTTEKPTTKSSSSSGQINSFTFFFPVLVGVFFCF